MDLPVALTAEQSARMTLRAGGRFLMETEVRATPLGLLAVGGLVAAILLSVPPIIRAAARAAEAHSAPRLGVDAGS
jgi:hypothetical protein